MGVKISDLSSAEKAQFAVAIVAPLLTKIEEDIKEEEDVATGLKNRMIACKLLGVELPKDSFKK
jgi:hypothetical protein